MKAQLLFDILCIEETGQMKRHTVATVLDLKIDQPLSEHSVVNQVSAPGIDRVSRNRRTVPAEVMLELGGHSAVVAGN